MRKSSVLFLSFALLLLPAALRAADPVVSNLSAAQRAGTKLVDISYDVTAETPTVVTFLEISSGGGATEGDPFQVTGAWDYLDRIENENGTNLGYPIDGSGNAWNSVAFDVATSTIGPWESEDIPIQTGGINGFPGAPDLLFGIDASPNGENLITTYLFRNTFEITAEQLGEAGWLIDYLIDDGAVVYINETEVFRTPSMPAGAVGTTTLSTVGNETASSTGNLNLSGILVEGTNSIAVEVHQTSLSSSDVGFQLQMTPASQYVTFVPVTAVSGDIGADIAVGTGKTVTWNAGIDWNQQISSQTRFRVIADEGVPTARFAAVAAGALPANSWAGAQRVDGFYMGKTEVTWARWQEVRRWAGTNGYDIGSVGQGSANNYPVTNVSWYHVVKWCNAASEKEGLDPVYKVGAAVYRTGDLEPSADESANGYRLPSEKEWEFAARGGVATNGYEYSGSNNVYEVAWYELNSGGAVHEVATKQPNELGLWDMSGNVYEWCFDMEGGANRIARSGSWASGTSYCRVAHRGGGTPTGLYNDLGFRVARSLKGPGSAVIGDVLVDTWEWTLSKPGVTANGSITGDGTYPPGTSATLTAIPDPGYLFFRWTGDASGTGNPLTLVMDGDRTVGATFGQDQRDPDGDGLSNYEELVLHGTDPNDADTDRDGVSDGTDVFPRDSSEDSDTDGDGIGNNADPDDDNDGINDEAEGPLGTDPLLADTDGDGLGDGDEIRYSYDPTNPDSNGDGTLDGLDDSDGDGLTAVQEIAAGTSPRQADTDGDGLDDPAELNTHGTDPANPDSDGDLLEDGVEVTITDTNPLLADTDGNGTSDGDEDPDRDRYTNLQEVDILLTDPLDSTSRFAFEFAHSPTNHSLSFTALSGRGYLVERSVDVSDPTKWAEVISFVGSGSAVTVPLGPPFSQRWFYRVVVSLD